MHHMVGCKFILFNADVAGLELVSASSELTLENDFLLYTSCVLGCTPLCFFNEIELLIKKKF
jgi:hypothetical protein